MTTATMSEKSTTPGPVWICKAEGYSPDERAYEIVCDRCSHRDQDLGDRWVYVRPVRSGDVCQRCAKAIGGGR